MLTGARGGVFRLIGMNLLSFLIALPVISWFYLVLNTYVNAGLDQGVVDILPGIGYFAGLLLQLPTPVFYGLFFLSALLIGPIALGLHAVARRLIQGNTVLFSDFVKLARQNGFHGLLLGLFCVIAVHLSIWNAFGGLEANTPWLSFLLTVSRWVSLLFLVLLFLALPFICQITVSIQLPLWGIVKNAIILARVYLGRGLLVLIGILAYWWITAYTVPMAGFVGLPLLSMIITVFLQAGLCFPLVEKHVLKPAGEGGTPS